MKKYFYLIALMAIAPLAISCGGDDGDDNGGGSSTVTLPAPAYKADATKINFSDTPIVDARNIESLELTESGDYIVTYTPALASRGAAGKSYLTGSYTKGSGTGTYVLSGFTTVVIVKDVKTYVVHFKTDGDDVEGTGTEAPTETESIATDNLCRTWTITKTELKLELKDAPAVGRVFSGTFNVNEVVEYANSNGASIEPPKESLIIKNLKFSKHKTYEINYESGRQDVGEWSWANVTTQTLKYNWDDPDAMGNEWESGRGSVEFFSDKTCKFTIEAKTEGIGDVKGLKIILTMR